MDELTPPADEQPGTAPRHPVLACLDTVRDAMDRVRDVDPADLTPAQKSEALLGLHRAGERLHALQLAVLAVADDLAATNGSRSPGAWLDQHTACGHREARRSAQLASALAGRWTGTRAALAEGHLSREHAAVIVAALDRLPPDVHPDLVTRCERELIRLAASFDPHALRRIGASILTRVAPEIGEEHDRRALEAEERAAHRRTWFAMHRAGDGTTYLRARIPDPVAARLATVLQAFTSPRRPGRPPDGSSAPPAESVAATSDGDADTGCGEVERLPADHRLGLGFCALLERLPEEILPEHGGTATTVNVLVELSTLLTGLGAATLADPTTSAESVPGDTGAAALGAGGAAISAGTARRLACTAHLVPVVLGTDSEVLDLGRRTRLYNRAQRHAMTLRDRHCRARGCTIPAAWCEAHHLHPWSRGGRTDVADGLLLCTFHHHRIHDEHYEHHLAPDRRVEFHRRT